MFTRTQSNISYFRTEKATDSLLKNESKDLWDDEEDDDDVFGGYEEDLDMDEEEIISFLNEYYLIYPKRLPEAQLY